MKKALSVLIFSALILSACESTDLQDRFDSKAKPTSDQMEAASTDE